jgi:hypothetical protein
MNQQYFDVIMKGGPIPGSSLTSDPDNPAPYERPPEYTNVHEAAQWLFSEMIEEANYQQLIQAMLDDIPVMDVAQVMLFTGFTEGKWDVNLMMLLIEPTAYMLLALAERAGIDPVIFRGEEEDEIEEELMFGTKMSEEKIKNLQTLSDKNIPLPFVEPKQKRELESLPTAEEMSLEEQDEPPEPIEEDSLLSAPKVEEDQDG